MRDGVRINLLGPRSGGREWRVTSWVCEALRVALCNFTLVFETHKACCVMRAARINRVEDVAMISAEKKEACGRQQDATGSCSGDWAQIALLSDRSTRT